MLTPKDVLDIAEQTNKFYSLARSIWPTQLDNWQKPVWNTKLRGTTAGRAYLQTNIFRINPELYVQNREHLLLTTVPHEIAHLVAYRVFGDRGHGNGWKTVMRRFGLVPERCHNLDVSTVKRAYTRTRYVYSCPCCKLEYKLTSQMHKSTNRYICRNDKTPLVFSAQIKISA